MAMSSLEKNEICRPAMDADLFNAAMEGNSNVLIQRLEVPTEGRNEIQREKLHERLPMSAELLKAAIEGDRDHLVQLLGIKEQEVLHDHKIIMDPSGCVLKQEEAANNKAEYDNLHSTTRFGNTVLHILVINGHDELACMVLKKDISLLRVCNKMLETPLHCASQVGNVEVINKLNEIAPDEVKDAFRDTNSNGETALHVAAKHGQEEIVRLLMRLDRDMAYRVDADGFSPLNAAIVGAQATAALAMLEADPSLGYIQDSNGLYPIHLAASKGPFELVLCLLQMYPDLSKLQDHCRRNLFHIKAEENDTLFFGAVFNWIKMCYVDGEMVSNMIKSTDYQGNTPLHIAAMKGHIPLTKLLWERMKDLEAVKNKAGLTAFDLWVICHLANDKTESGMLIESKISSQSIQQFCKELFDDVLKTDKDKWERSQIIGLGSVLIATVAFAAAFTIPGGYNSDNGTPVLGRRYMFRAFILANALAFIQAFKSLFTIVTRALIDPLFKDLQYAIYTFLSAASCMMVAFGLGSYVTLAPINLPVAVIVLVVSLLLGSPAVFWFLPTEQNIFMRFVFGSVQGTPDVGTTGLKVMLGSSALPLLLIFCLAFS